MGSLDVFLDRLGPIDAVLWGPWTLAFIAGVSVFFTVRSGFYQFRGLRYILHQTLGRLTRGGGGKDGSLMSPFQAAATSLAGTVGMGNMAGVATALSVGGAGAIFWMWLMALFGMMSKTAEITLGVYYRERGEDGSMRGGPQFSIRRGLGWRPLAVLFSAGMLVNAVVAASLLQAHTVGRAFLASYEADPYVVTGAMGLVTAAVVLGGAKRIGGFSAKLVPVMTLAYLSGAIVVIVANVGAIPGVFETIFANAFTTTAGVGGAAGVAVTEAIKQGMSRGMLSNEAGLGTAPMVHATAETEHPFQQGVWGAFEVFFDTIVICSITAFAILSTGAMASGASGIELVLAAFQSELPANVAALIVAGSIATFSLSTQIGFYIYFETCVVDLVGARPLRWLKWFYFLPAVVFAGVADVDRLWVLANIAVAVVSLPNLVALLCLSPVFLTLMQDELSGKRRYATAETDGRPAELVGLGASVRPGSGGPSR